MPSRVRDPGEGDLARCIVVLNGAFRMSPALRAAFQGARVIAADGGLLRLQRHGISPGLVLGDFDSLGDHPPGATARRFARAKDETDGELALRAALDEGMRHVTLVGAFSGRFDMAVGHIALLRWAAARGAKALLTDGLQAARLAPRLRMPVGPRGARLSVVPLTPSARLTSHGLRWPLDGAALRWDEMRGNSNRVETDDAWIRLVAGQALAVLPYSARWSVGG